MGNNRKKLIHDNTVSWVVFLFFIALVFSILFTGSLDTIPFVKWVQSSTYPVIGFIAISLLFTDLIWLLFRSGKISEIKFEILGVNFSVEKIIIQVPPVFLSITSLISLVFILFFSRPTCSPPNFQFEVQSGDLKKFVEQQGSVELISGTSAIVSVVSDQRMEDLRCDWKSNSEIFKFINPTVACLNTIHLKNLPGEGILTVSVQNKYCPGTIIANLSVKTK